MKKNKTVSECYMRPEDLVLTGQHEHFCTQCSTCLVDFRGMSDEQIVLWFQKNNKTSVCALKDDNEPNAVIRYFRNVRLELRRTIQLYQGCKMAFRLAFIILTLGFTSCRKPVLPGYSSVKDYKKTVPVIDKKDT